MEAVPGDDTDSEDRSEKQEGEDPEDHEEREDDKDGEDRRSAELAKTGHAGDGAAPGALVEEDPSMMKTNTTEGFGISSLVQDLSTARSLESASSQRRGNQVVNFGGLGHWSATCTCPDGETYQVADQGNNCGSFYCMNGKVSGGCNKGRRSSLKVTCGKKQDCEWDDWEDWDECSKTCGGGKTSRTRKVDTKEMNGGKKCKGKKKEEKECNKDPCPIPTTTPPPPLTKADASRGCQFGALVLASVFINLPRSYQ